MSKDTVKCEVGCADVCLPAKELLEHYRRHAPVQDSRYTAGRFACPMNQHVGVPGLLQCSAEFESTRGVLVHLCSAQHQAWLRKFQPSQFIECPDCEDPVWLPDMFWWLRHLRTHAVAKAVAVELPRTVCFAGDPALSLRVGQVRPLLFVRKSGRINVADFDKAVARSEEYWGGLLTWAGIDMRGVAMPVVRANGVRTLFFPQPRRVVRDQVLYDKHGRLVVLLAPHTPHAADLRASLRKSFDMIKAFSQGVNIVCTQGIDGLTCNWGLLKSLCREQRRFVMILALSLKDRHLKRIRHMWANVHMYRGRQILFVRSEEIAAGSEKVVELKALMDLQQAGKETLENISRNQL